MEWNINFNEIDFVIKIKKINNSCNLYIEALTYMHKHIHTSIHTCMLGQTLQSKLRTVVSV